MTKSYEEHLKEHRTQRRKLLLNSAARALATTGIRQATMDLVAEEAGVKKMVLYRYFGSKDKLVHAVLENVVDELLFADDAEADWWTDRVKRTLAVARQNPDAMKLLVRHSAHDPEFGVHLTRLNEVLVERFEERVSVILGTERINPESSRFLAHSANAFFFEAYAGWIDQGMDRDDDELLDWITQSVRAMVYYWGKEDPPSIKKA